MFVLQTLLCSLFISCTSNVPALTSEEKSLVGKYYSIKSDTLEKNLYYSVESYGQYKDDRVSESCSKIKLTFLLGKPDVNNLVLEYELNASGHWNIADGYLIDRLDPQSFDLKFKKSNQQGAPVEKMVKILDVYLDLCVAQMKEEMLKQDSVKILTISPHEFIFEWEGKKETLMKLKE